MAIFEFELGYFQSINTLPCSEDAWGFKTKERKIEC